MSVYLGVIIDLCAYKMFIFSCFKLRLLFIIVARSIVINLTYVRARLLCLIKQPFAETKM